MIKYTIPYKSADNTQWRIDLENVAYTGVQIQLRSVTNQTGILSYDGEADNPFAVLINTSLDFTIHNEANIDVNEIEASQDRDWIVKQYRNEAIYWTGFLVCEGISRPLLSNPTQISFKAICGLTMLERLNYSHADLDGGRVPINYIRQILFANLGIMLPIRWTNNLQCTAFIGQDVFAGGVQWSTNNEGFYSYQSGQNGDDQGPIKSCAYILEGILKSNQCRIYQANGKWLIRRINDFVGGSFTYKQIQGNLNALVLAGGNENVLKQVGRSGYQFQNEDQIVLTKQGVKTVRVTYESNQRENIIPNGNQDLTIGSSLLYWGFYGSFGQAQISSPLTGRGGNAALLIATNPSSNSFYTLKAPLGTSGNDGLPIDTQTMVPYINFSFLFAPINGFPNTGGVIDWSTNPFEIKVIFNCGATKYYLNEFGFWQLDEITIPIVIDGSAYGEVARVDFNKFQNVIMPLPASQPIAGDTSDIVIQFVLKPGQQYKLDNISITLDGGNEVYESTYDNSKNTTVEETSVNISSAFGGYQVSNFMTNWSESDSECFFRDGLYFENTLTAMTANAMMRFMYKSSKIYNGSMNVREQAWSFDEMYFIDSFFNEKFLPMPGTKYNTEKEEVFLVAMQSRNDNVIFTQKFYNSNDKPLSN